MIGVENKEIEQINKTSLLPQTSFWGKVKREQGAEAMAFRISFSKKDMLKINSKSDIHANDLLVIIQYLDRENSIAYVPYGPTAEPEEGFQGTLLEELSESLRPYLPEKCILIRYDLPWESPWAKEKSYFDSNDSWLGPPPKDRQEFRVNFNTRNWNLRKAISDNLPSNTIFLDLNRTKDSLLQNMKAKTRYNIRLAKRKGVEVYSRGIENLDDWHKLYRETAKRNKINLHNTDHFRTVLSTPVSDCKAPAETELLMAVCGGEPLAAMFLAVSGNRGTYLYGASSSANRNYMATYALQWNAIQRAISKGCTEYDMFGVAPKPDPNHPMYGLYKFKKGFGGRLFHRMGCWDYPYDEGKYRLFTAVELKQKGYHKN